MKKIIAFLLASALLFVLTGCNEDPGYAPGSGTTQSGQQTTSTGDQDDPYQFSNKNDLFEYSVYSRHVEITKYIGQATEVYIPAELNDCPVTVIGERAFSDRASMVSVDIPDTVTTISDAAFYRCYYLTAITGCKSVRYIGSKAFAYNRSLTSFPWPESLKNVGKRAFFWCESLPSIDIPASCDNIEQEAFACCSNATAITFADGMVEYIGTQAFMECRSVTKLEYPYATLSIEEGAFKHLYALKDLTFDERVSTIGEKMFQHCEAIEEITIPANIKTIKGYAFGSCFGVKKIVFEGTDTDIGQFILLQNNTFYAYVHRNSKVELYAIELWGNSNGMDHIIYLD